MRCDDSQAGENCQLHYKNVGLVYAALTVFVPVVPAAPDGHERARERCGSSGNAAECTYSDLPGDMV